MDIRKRKDSSSGLVPFVLSHDFKNSVTDLLNLFSKSTEPHWQCDYLGISVQKRFPFLYNLPDIRIFESNRFERLVLNPLWCRISASRTVQNQLQPQTVLYKNYTYKKTPKKQNLWPCHPIRLWRWLIMPVGNQLLYCLCKYFFKLTHNAKSSNHVTCFYSKRLNQNMSLHNVFLYLTVCLFVNAQCS